MSVAPQFTAGPGSAAIPEYSGDIAPTSQAQIDHHLERLEAQKVPWATLGIPERIHLIERCITDTAGIAESWVNAAMEAKRLSPGTRGEGEEWLAGPFTFVRNLQLLQRSLKDIERHGCPRLPSGFEQRPGGRVSAKVFPTDMLDALFFLGFRADVWLKPGVTEDDARARQAQAYRGGAEAAAEMAKVALVLGAGNVASIGPMDLLYKLFVENQVAVLKMNPVNAYLGPFFEVALSAFIEAGYVALVYGGAEQGIYLCQHPLVEEIHITGSDKTHDAIVYGVGDEGRQNKVDDTPINTRRITSELGNVSPVIVVPGPWSASDIQFQAENLASMLVNNAGFNCNATRVIITHKGWDQREALLDAIRATLADIETRAAYYPGANERHQAFLDAHPEAEFYGSPKEDELPWTFITGVEPNAEDICLSTEAFCGVFSEVPLEASDTVSYINEAVRHCNETVWGTLNAAIIVHPRSTKRPGVQQAVDDAVATLRYGAIGVNHWPAVSYGMGSTSWGAFPGHTNTDIQSGRDVVHNTYMLDPVEKSVVYGPFRVFPKPPWFATHRNIAATARLLFKAAIKPSLLKVPAVLLATLRG